jgi:excisionase family DNA binding protein
MAIKGHIENSPTEKLDNRDSDAQADILTVDEVASFLRVNRNTVYDLFRSGEIPGGRNMGKRLIRFSRKAVLEWVATGNGPVSQSSRR